MFYTVFSLAPTERACVMRILRSFIFDLPGFLCIYTAENAQFEVKYAMTSVVRLEFTYCSRLLGLT